MVCKSCHARVKKRWCVSRKPPGHWRMLGCLGCQQAKPERMLARCCGATCHGQPRRAYGRCRYPSSVGPKNWCRDSAYKPGITGFPREKPKRSVTRESDACLKFGLAAEVNGPSQSTAFAEADETEKKVGQQNGMSSIKLDQG